MRGGVVMAAKKPPVKQVKNRKNLTPAQEAHLFKKGQSGNPKGRPKGKTLKEALLEYLALRGASGATNAAEIADAMGKRVRRGDVEILDRVIMLTEDKPAEAGNVAHVLISMDK